MQPIGGNMNLDASPLFAPMQAPTPKKKKTGMFGGNIGEVRSAAINGYLAAGGNQAGMMGLQQLHARRAQQQQSEQEAQQYQRQREDGFQDWVRKQAYEQANKPVDRPSYADDLIAAGMQPGSPEFQQLYGQYVKSKAMTGGSPFGPMFTDPATGQRYMMPSQPQAGPQPGAIENGYRFKGGNAGDPNAWEPVQGGPTAPQSGGFR